MDLEGKKMGRPRTPEYRKKKFRYSAIEDRFKTVLEQMESVNDRRLVEEVLKQLRA